MVKNHPEQMLGRLLSSGLLASGSFSFITRFLCLLASITVTVLLSAGAPLSAHEGRPIYIELTEITPGDYTLRWKIPPVMATRDIPMIRLTGCEKSAGAPLPSLIGQRTYNCPAPESISITYPGINPVLSTLVLYKGQNGFQQSQLTGPDEAIIPIPYKADFWAVAGQYSLSGIDHILEGYDHLLFVLCLILLSGSLKRILLTVTGFTLGHSVTLGMSAIGGWSLSPSFVEPLIAFSILMLAVEVCKGQKDTLAYRYPALIATGFGLLHGFGFGGALAEIGLPKGMQLQALAFFNIGVEAGQILFVIVAYSAYIVFAEASKIIRPSFHAASLKPLVIYPAGFIAAFWTLERVIGIWV